MVVQNTESEVKEIRNVINIIGEPVLKIKLSQMFEVKTGIPIDLNQEISNLEERLSNLKRIQNQ